MFNKYIVILAVTLILVGACVTVNIYFPAEAVKRAADEIVNDVYTSNKPNGSMLIDKPSRPSIFGGVAWAQNIDINITSPGIRVFRSSMETRFISLRPFYDGGNVGITNRGYVEIRNAGGLDLKTVGDLNGLVGAENNDRRNLYGEIAAANSFGPDAVPQIEKLFAQSWREQASFGWWVQNDDGAWVKK